MSKTPMKFLSYLLPLCVLCAMTSCDSLSSRHRILDNSIHDGTGSGGFAWGRREYDKLAFSIEIPRDVHDDVISFADPNWKNPPQLAMRELSFTLLKSELNDVSVPSGRIDFIFEHFKPEEWREYLSGKRVTSLGYENRDSPFFQGHLTKEIGDDGARIFYRKDFKIMNGCIVIAGAIARMSAVEQAHGRLLDDAMVCRILNSVKSL